MFADAVMVKFILQNDISPPPQKKGDVLSTVFKPFFGYMILIEFSCSRHQFKDLLNCMFC